MGEQMILDQLSAARLEAQKASGARERLQKLFDKDTFVELDVFAKNSGVVTGCGEIEGTAVFAFSQDVGQHGGAVGREQAAKLVRLYDLAVKAGAPVVGVYDSKGADIAQGNEVLRAYGEILDKAANLSGVVPQVSLVLGVCAGVGAMAACCADFVVMGEGAELFVTPPAVSADKAASGTAQAALQAGVAQIVEPDEDAAIAAARRLLSLLPANNLSAAATFEFAEPAGTAVLAGITDKLDGTALCDITKAIVDEGSLLVLGKGFGEGAQTALATIGGYTVGIVGTGGALDSDGAARIARFVSVCDSFQIPVVTFINTAGVKPSGADELAGSIRDMARLGHVYAEATTPKIAVVTGSAIGAAYVALGSADVTLAWPGAVVSAMPVPAAVAFLKGSEITKEHSRAQAEEAYKQNEASVYAAAADGLVQDIVAPADTRRALTQALDMLSGKRVSRLPKKHANLPL